MQYFCFSENITGEDNAIYTAYGIKFKSDADEKLIRDITLNENEIRILCTDLNFWQPDECHIKDVVEDFICKINTMTVKSL